MSSKMNKVWYLKHRPTTMEDFVHQNAAYRQDFEEYIKTKNIPHMLLCGHHGTGKSSLVQILLNNLNLDEVDIKYINASENNKVDYIRTEVKQFCERMSFNGDVTKVVHMEEADRLTHDSQELLRAYMDDYADNVRFILSCNYKHRIIGPLLSRCRVYEFTGMSKLDAIERAAIILHEEGIQCELETLEQYVDMCYPDMRKLIDTLQNKSKTGTLLDPLESSASATYEIELIAQLKKRDWVAARKCLAGNVSPTQWDEVYTLLYNNVDLFTSKHDDAIITIADHLYKHAFVADPEINMTALLINLGRL